MTGAPDNRSQIVWMGTVGVAICAGIGSFIGVIEVDRRSRARHERQMNTINSDFDQFLDANPQLEVPPFVEQQRAERAKQKETEQ